MSDQRDGIHRISVDGEFRHDVLVGRGLLARAAERARACGVAAGARVLLVVDRGAAAHAGAVEASVRAAGHAYSRLEIEATEQGKSVEAVAAIWAAALAARLDRRDLIVAVGGGLVGDVAGFAAASYLRGIRWLAVPTTLLAMVDASTGGKTGINLPLPSATGAPPSLVKNMAGAFWPPVEVLADPVALTTLPRREFGSGLAECIKHAVIDGEAHVGRLDELLVRLGTPPLIDLAAAADLVAMSVAVKARIVTQDPREQGLRALLNFGHTFGHGLETAPELDLTHGEAVGLGMLAAMHAAERVMGFPPAQTQRIRGLLERASLPASVRLCLSNLDNMEGDAADAVATGGAAPSIDSVVERMGFDKKSHAGVVRFVLPRAFGDVEPKVELAPRVVREALSAIGCRGALEV